MSISICRYGYMYVAISSGGYLKIGKSIHPKERCYQLSYENKYGDVYLLFQVYFSNAINAYGLESELHNKYSDNRLPRHNKGDWFWFGSRQNALNKAEEIKHYLKQTGYCVESL